MELIITNTSLAGQGASKIPGLIEVI